MGGRLNEQGNLTLVLGSSKIVGLSPYLLAKNLNVYAEALSEFRCVPCPEGFNNTLLSRGPILGAASGNGADKWNAHSKDWGRVRKPPVAGDQLTGQVVATSSS